MTTNLNLPPIEDIDVEDLPTLPGGYGYELHEGDFVIMTPSTFSHRDITARQPDMLLAVGLRAYQAPGVLGDRPPAPV
jgi:hypothetical protein